MEFSLGVVEIDQQHDGIFALLKVMRAAAAARANWYARYEQVSKLREKSTLHFEVEESLMRIHGFPGLDLHAREHREFETLLSELLLRSVHTPLGEGAVEFLEQWWALHIPRHDREYMEWFVRAPQPFVAAQGMPARPAPRLGLGESI